MESASCEPSGAFSLHNIVRQEPTHQNTNKNSQKKWLKRIGIAGFLFFLIKGLAWLAVMLFAWKGCK